MTWDHRVLRHKNGDLEIVEMIYEDEKPTGWCDATVYADAGGDPMCDLQDQIVWFTLALNKPIIDDWTVE